MHSSLFLPRAQRIRRALLLLLLAMATLGAITVGSSDPPSAEARTKWFWTERKAETRIKQRFSDIRSVDCSGLGYNRRYDRYGRELFAGFYCYGSLTNRSEFQITIYTTGRNRFKWYPY